MGSLDAVFLDRDGTINVKAPEGSYIAKPSQLRLLPGAADAIRALNDAGVLVLVVTNQRGVATGHMSLSDVDDVHKTLSGRLRRSGARVDGFYVCPHPDESCGCRKPAPGLLFQASRDHPGLRLDRSVMIGDSEIDVEAATAAGAGAIRLGPETTGTGAAWLYPDLAAAVRALVGSPAERPDAGRAVFRRSPTAPGFGRVNSRSYLIKRSAAWVQSIWLLTAAAE
jgi:D-glycero-D-manno-heptose 1,7-bisphosphate phosphatase